jgi:hypothetical protein
MDEKGLIGLFLLPRLLNDKNTSRLGDGGCAIARRCFALFLSLRFYLTHRLPFRL